MTVDLAPTASSVATPVDAAQVQTEAPMQAPASSALPAPMVPANPEPPLHAGVVEPASLIPDTPENSPVADFTPPVPPPVAANVLVVPDPTEPLTEVAVDPVAVPITVPTRPDTALQPPVGPGTVPDLPLAPSESIILSPTAAPAKRPEPGFGAPVNGVTTGRLPRIGAVTPETPNATPDAFAEEDSRPAHSRFARAFDNPAAKPLFAIILIDTGGPDLDRESLASLPFPVSFALDPTAPDATTAEAIYRRAGQEVVMLATGLPGGATAADIEVTFQQHDRALAQTVAVMDLAEGGFQGNRALATQVLQVVGGQGRGILSWDRGLNAASQVARRDGLQNALIFRSLDAEGEGAPIIRRYLDRAAFKAAQDGRVVVAGLTRPETVAALLEWAVEGRAATVALAPVSAVMTAQ